MENNTALWLPNDTLIITDLAANNSSTASIQAFLHVPKYGPPLLFFICILLGILILATILGNVFVIAAILTERSLHGVSNYLILSLAVTDLMVAVLVMPLSVVKEVSLHWYLGNEVCDMYVSMDVLCCTASILHLVAIALDRFWAVSNIDYIRRRCARQILLMIAVVWFVSVSISIPPLFGWKDDANNPSESGNCLISQDYGYTIFSTVGAFYFPLILMVVLNFKIYKAARSRIRKKKFGGRPRHCPLPTVAVENATTNPQSRNSSGSDVSQDGFSVYNGSCVNMNEISRVESTLGPLGENGLESSDHGMQNSLGVGNHLTVPTAPFAVTKTRSNNNSKRAKNREKDRLRKEKIEMRRERKAARVLGIITGVFILCWLPFFLVALIAPFCGPSCIFPEAMMSVFLWLGYFNSLLNPIIYTVFNPSFRNAFRKIFYKKLRRGSW